MICYFASPTSVRKRLEEFLACNNVDNLLVSYASIFNKDICGGLNNVNRLFLDSGAYSAYTKGMKIDINDYIRYIKESDLDWTAIANLDVIEDAEASYRNWLTMRKAGINAIPVFHTNENFDYLRRYCDETDYVGIGGIAIRHEQWKFLRKYLSKCFSIAASYNRNVKFHGFGLGMNMDVLTRFPFFSADSTTYLFLHMRIGTKFKYFLNYRYPEFDIGQSLVDRKNNSIEKWSVGVAIQRKIERFITELWRKRGITWEE